MMNRPISLWLTSLLLAVPVWSAGQVRERRNFDADWRFHLGEIAGAQSAVPGQEWRKVDLPHDWSIEGPYAESNPSGGGYLPGGIGWYRKTFLLPASLRGQRISIEFDGAYHNSEVWINGHTLGRRPYGYSSFAYDLTPYLKFGQTSNLLAVRLDHTDIADSRWYTGSGIYRHVWLGITQPIHVAHWGTFIRTPVVRESEALVSIETRVRNDSAVEALVRVHTVLRDPSGMEVASESAEARVGAGKEQTVVQQVRVSRPALWSPDRPNLYASVSQLSAGGTVTDEYRTPFGIRSIRFDPDRGFFLNNQPLKFRGVCLHHDLGGLGAAAYEAGIERRLQLLKGIGVNAIRASHNPMSPEFYELCDRLGLLVMDEAFDEWTGGKHKWEQGWNVGVPGTRGYHEYFDEWSTRDLEDMVLRDRNHPSIVMWSIGNEIDYPGDPFTHPYGRDGSKPQTPSANLLELIGRRLLATVKGLDPTRPVTQALADIDASNAVGLASLLDVTGYNYQEQHYDRDHAAYPERVILGTENSRNPGVWRPVVEKPFVTGQFLWTGFDYLGEAARYPHRGSESGLFDYCGFQKPEGYVRQAMWSELPMVWAAVFEGEPPAGSPPDGAPAFEGRRLAAHWNWSGRKTVAVEVLSNCESVELQLNGRSLGEKPVTEKYPPRVSWTIPYEPGSLIAVGKRGGHESARFALETAGDPAAISVTPDKQTLRKTGSDLAHLVIQVVDAHGNRVWNAGEEITVEVSGDGVLAGLDNADPRDLASYQSGRRKAWRGRLLAVVRAGRSAGEITVRVSGSGLKSASTVLTVD